MAHWRDGIKETNPWQPMGDCLWAAEDEVVLLVGTQEITAKFIPGTWSEDPSEGRIYSGTVWSCFDGKFTIPVEELSCSWANWIHEGVRAWRYCTPAPDFDTGECSKDINHV